MTLKYMYNCIGHCSVMDTMQRENKYCRIIVVLTIQYQYIHVCENVRSHKCVLHNTTCTILKQCIFFVAIDSNFFFNSANV